MVTSYRGEEKKKLGKKEIIKMESELGYQRVEKEEAMGGGAFTSVGSRCCSILVDFAVVAVVGWLVDVGAAYVGPSRLESSD